MCVCVFWGTNHFSIRLRNEGSVLERGLSGYELLLLLWGISSLPNSDIKSLMAACNSTLKGSKSLRPPQGHKLMQAHTCTHR